MYGICADKKLWTRVDAICDGHSPSHVCIPSYVHAETVSMKFRKLVAQDEPEDGLDTCFGKNFFTNGRGLTNLKILHVTKHQLNCESVRFLYFF